MLSFQTGVLKFLSRIVLSACLTVLGAGYSVAGVLRVPSEFPDVTSASTIAQHGDTILVDPGAYYEPSGVFLRDGVTLLSQSGRDSTVIYTETGTALTFLPPEPGATHAPSLCRGFALSTDDEVYNRVVVSRNPNTVIDECIIGGGGSISLDSLIHLYEGGSVRRSTLLNWAESAMFVVTAPGSHLLVEDCVIDGVLTSFLSGLCCYPPGGVIEFRNNTIVVNEMFLGNVGGNTDFTIEFVNNIFYENSMNTTYPDGLPDRLSFRYNVYWNNIFYQTPEEFFVNGVGNFEADPLFCDDPETYWLQPESPCLGAGENGEDIGARIGICGVSGVGGDSALDLATGLVRIRRNPSAGPVEFVLAASVKPDGISAWIFSTEGRRVAKLEASMDGRLVWNARDDAETAANGTYFIALFQDARRIGQTSFVLLR